MSGQTAFLQALDTDLMAALADAGMADAATYLPPSGIGTPVACIVAVDRALRNVGDDVQAVQGGVTIITLQRAQIPASEHGAYITLTATGEIFRLAELDARDESQCRWVVVPE